MIRRAQVAPSPLRGLGRYLRLLGQAIEYEFRKVAVFRVGALVRGFFPAAALGSLLALAFAFALGLALVLGLVLVLVLVLGFVLVMRESQRLLPGSRPRRRPNAGFPVRWPPQGRLPESDRFR